MLHHSGLTGVFSIFEVFKQSHQLILIILCPWNLCGAEKKKRKKVSVWKSVLFQPECYSVKQKDPADDVSK